MRAREQRDAMLEFQAERAAAKGLALQPAGIDQNSWELLGPPAVGGRIRSIIIHPQLHDFMLVGAATGGIWRTLNGGQSWGPSDDFMASLTIGSMAIDSVDPLTVYAGTGEGFFEQPSGEANTAPIRGEGIFKSINFGATWFQLASTANDDFDFVNRISVGGTGMSVVLAATSTGIHRSVDSGASWVEVYDHETYDVKFHPGDSLFAVAADHDGIPLYSNDGGVTWNEALGFPPDGNRIELAWSRSVFNKVYAASHKDDGMYVAVSTDLGQNYVQVTIPPLDPDPMTDENEARYDAFGSYALALWVDPTNDSKVLIAGFAVYASADGGITFDRISAGHEDHHVLIEHPEYGLAGNKVVFNGNDGGIYKWDDPFAAALDCGAQAPVGCSDLNDGLVITQFYGADIHPSGAVIGGTQDNGTWVYDPLTTGWIQARGGDGAYSAVKRSAPNTMYFQAQGMVVYRTDNAGTTRTVIFNEDGQLASNFIAPLELDGNRLYVGGRSLWRTSNPGGNPPQWVELKPTICGPAPKGHLFTPDPCDISTIDVSPQNLAWIWVGYSGGEVWNTTNGGFDVPIWNRRADNGPLPARYVSDIVADPNDQERAYVSFMGYATDNVWKTEDFGGSWSDIGAGLPELPVNGLAVHPVLPGWIYAATELGIYSSEDDGLTWTAGNVGPSNVSVDELVFMNDKTLMAVTHGRGIWLVDSFDDCNGNMIPDFQDISSGTSNDVNLNAIPDECETGTPPGRIDPTTGRPIRLGKLAGGDVSIECSGSCSTGAIAFGVYEGTIGSWYSHAAISGKCSETCSGGIQITPSADNAYYLVVPHDGIAEGSYGTDLTSTKVRNERPRPSAVAERCAQFQVITECP